MSRYRAFTLIELLVVIAILMLLLSILTPSISGVLDRGRTLKCGTNARNIAGAALMYAGDNDRYVLRDFDLEANSTHYHWAARYAQYLGYTPVTADYDKDCDALYDIYKDIEVYHCPSIADPGDHVLHYVSNSLNFQLYRNKGIYRSGGAGPVRIMELPGSPSRMYHITDANLNNSQIGPYPRQFDYHDTWDADQVPFTGQTRNDDPRTIHADDPRHQGRTPVIFYDGHAEFRELTPEEFPTSLFNPLLETN